MGSFSFERNNKFSVYVYIELIAASILLGDVTRNIKRFIVHCFVQ